MFVSSSTSDADITSWILNNFNGGIRRLKLYNDKTNYKFKETGNFNMWLFGVNRNEMTGIAVNHWSGNAFSIRGHNGNDISVNSLYPFWNSIYANLVPTEVNNYYQYTNESLKNRNAIIALFNNVKLTVFVTPYASARASLNVKQDNQYWGGEVEVSYNRDTGTVTFAVIWKGSSQLIGNFELFHVVY